MEEAPPAQRPTPLGALHDAVSILDEIGLADALVKVAVRTAVRTAPRRALGLAFEMARIAAGRSPVVADAKDWRFTNRTWTENPLHHRLGQAYLATCRTADQLVSDAGLDWRTEERARFAVTLLTSTLAPTNHFLLNPDALERAFETGGKSMVRSLTNLSRDVLKNRGAPRTVNRSAFRVGTNVAVTPGAVVYRSEVFELLQYSPTTPTVHARPVVLVPPQINKYYFMDMAPGRSFVEYAVNQGFQMFVVSWRNPGPEHAEWNLDTYVSAVGDAFRVAAEITDRDDVSTIALCAGGITTAALLGHLAATQDRLVHSAAFAVTLLDFDEPTLIGMLGTQRVIDKSVRSSRRSGVLDAHKLSMLFALLRPNDLVWNYWVRNNLLGEEPPDFDVLAWNADATRLAAGLHADFLDIFLNNSFAAGTVNVLGTPVDLSKVECDNFVVGARTDHLTGWKACYSTTQLLGGASQFVLSSSGHIQSLVNPPGNPKMTVTTGPEPGADRDEWLAAADTAAGSWWERWAEWQAARGGGRRPAPATLGSPRNPPGDPAPGPYVVAG